MIELGRAGAIPPSAAIACGGIAPALRILPRDSNQFESHPEIHLLNVQHPLPGTIQGVAEQARQFHQEQGLAALSGARKILDDAKVRYNHHISVGEAGPVVARMVEELKCDQVIMGTRGTSAIANMVLGSVATKVLHAVNVPVLLVK